MTLCDYQIRFMTSHPKDASHKLIDTIAAQPKICKHLHLPVQSGSDRILHEMNRHYNVEQYLELMNYAKQRVPGITFSSDIIVGFPGETEEDFAKTLELVAQLLSCMMPTHLAKKSPRRLRQLPSASSRSPSGSTSTASRRRSKYIRCWTG